MSTDPRPIAIVVILVHLAVTIVHGISHNAAGVALNLFGYIFVYAIILLAPLIAAVLIYKVSLSIGGWLMTLSMIASLCFGVVNHFLLSGTDNVTAVHGPSHALFLWSALGVAITEFIGALVGIWLLQEARTRVGSR